MTVSEALDYVKNIVPLSYIASRMGVHRVVLSHAKAHIMVNGKPYYLPEDKTELLRKTIRDIANDILTTQLKPEYGDYADQLQELKSTTLNIRTFTINYLGKSIGWMNCRVTHQPYKDRLGNMRDYYNNFTDSDIKDINKALHAVALDLLALDIQTEYSPEVEESLCLVNNFSISSEEQQQLLQDEIDLGLI